MSDNTAVFNPVTQLGFVVKDIDKSAQVWADFLSLDLPEIFIVDPVEKRHAEYNGRPSSMQAKQAFFHLDNITIELIEPLDENSAWKECLDEKGEGIHRIAFHMKNVENNIEFLRIAGGKLVQCGHFVDGPHAAADAPTR